MNLDKNFHKEISFRNPKHVTLDSSVIVTYSLFKLNLKVTYLKLNIKTANYGNTGAI